MEIKIDDIRTIKSNGIYSFIGTNKSIKSKMIKPILKNIENNVKKVKCGYCTSNPYDLLKKKTVKECLQRVLQIYDYDEKYIEKRVYDSFRILDMDTKYLDYNISDLDYVEAKKISLLVSLIHNPKIIILEDFTDTLVNFDRKQVSRLLRLLKNKYKKIILLFTKDTDFCYEISDYIYVLDNKKIVKEGNKYILKDIKLLNKLGLKVPPIIEFIAYCNKNNHEIGDYTSILDLIKAIYREVR